jgi:hypothetical protein
MIRKNLLATVVVATILIAAAWSAQVTIPYPPAYQTTIRSSEMLANLNALTAGINSINDTQIASNAAITGSKILAGSLGATQFDAGTVASFTLLKGHVASATNVHGLAAGVAVLGASATQTITNKTLDSTNSIAGEAINSGTVADARVASTLCRDSELTTHSGDSSDPHGATLTQTTIVSDSVDGVDVSAHVADASDPHGATLTQTTIVSNSVDGVDISAHVADASDPHGSTLTQTAIACNSVDGVDPSALSATVTAHNSDASDPHGSTLTQTAITCNSVDGVDVSAHVADTSTHGITSTIVGISETQSLTNKTLGTGCSYSGTAIPAANLVLTAVEESSEIDSDISTHNAVTTAHGATGAVMGTTNIQTVTNKAFSTGCSYAGTAIPAANLVLTTVEESSEIDSDIAVHNALNAAHGCTNIASATALSAHTGDASDPHGATLTQTAIVSNSVDGVDVSAHVADTSTHGVATAIVGTTETQTLTNKSISGEQINSGTVADARVASTLCRDSELTAHSGDASDPHGATLTQTTIVCDSVDGVDISAHTGDSSNPHGTTLTQTTIVSDSVDGVDISAHVADTTTHGVAGAIVGISDTQTLTNKTFSTGSIADAVTRSATFPLVNAWLGTAVAGPFTNGAAAVKITFASETVDLGSDYSAGTFTAPFKGLYLINARIVFSSYSGNCIVDLLLYVEGALVEGSETTALIDGQGTAVLSTTRLLNSGDTVDFYGQSTGGHCSAASNSGSSISITCLTAMP